MGGHDAFAIVLSCRRQVSQYDLLLHPQSILPELVGSVMDVKVSEGGREGGR